MSKIRRRKKCPKCGTLDIIKWGIQANHQRYKCKNCGHSFVFHNYGVSLSNRFSWFRRWVLGKQTLIDISKDSGYSERQLRRWFDEYLDKPPVWTIRRSKSINVLIDGTWFPGDRCLIVYRNQTDKTILFYRFSSGEYWNEITSDLEQLKHAGVKISSFTTDGEEDIIRAIKFIYPRAIRQRCVVHIERECLSWLTQHPKTVAGITLRRLVCQISYIKTNNDMLYWISQIHKWHDDHEEFIKQKTKNKETGEIYYTHDNVRRAYVHIIRALPNMFKYIDNPDVSNNTNGIEAYFSHLKSNLRIHRGLSIEHHQKFIKWYLYFSNEKKKKG